NDVSAEFAVKTVDGTLTIAKRKVMLTSNTLTKTYDGKPLTNGNEPITVSGDGFADGEGATYHFTGSQTVKGDSLNTFTYELNSNTEEGNYIIEKTEGKLIVRDRDQKYAIEVVANSGTYTYNGKEQLVTGLKATTFTTEDGGIYTVEGLRAEAQATDVGEYNVEVAGDPIVRDKYNNDVTDQFAIAKTDGKLVIEKATLTIEAASATKPYDGKALIAHRVENIEGVADGQEVVVDDLQYEGSQTEIGNSANKVVRASVNVVTSGVLGISFLGGGKDTTENYDIVLQDGILEVTQRYDLEYVINRIFLDGNGNKIATEVYESSKEAYFGEKILKTAPEAEVTRDNQQYVFLPDWEDYLATKDKTVSLIAEDNVVNVYYALDEKGNPDPDKPVDPDKPDIPDKPDGEADMYQTIFKYVSAGNGSVSGQIYEVHTFKENGKYVDKAPVNPKAEVEVHAAEKYAFDYWTIDGTKKDFHIGMDELKAEKYVDNTTFIVYFDKDEIGKPDPDKPIDPDKPDIPDKPDTIPDKYQIVFKYVSAGNGTVTGTTYEVHTFEKDGEYVEKTAINPIADVEVHAAEKYAFDYWTIDGTKKDFHTGMDILKAEKYADNTTFIVHFDKDEIGEKDPQKPDGIPDKYQITFTYVSEDAVNKGTVAGNLVEVVTRPQNADGSYNMEAEVNPKANVTVSTIGRYNFTKWNDGSADYGNVDVIKQTGFVKDTEFKAYFTYSGGGSPSGPSGGNSSGPNHNSSTPSGGPGATVITPEQVPLANLPGDAPVMIEDEEVPLAALPKTGRTSANGLVLLLSSVMLAAFAVAGRKKEDEQ
ncbi:MAG: doubled motif LPXTG anchor domain-containing protein, partial [Eubacteriales bacterium]|nr:doubled motif LPXTG anchor domain-containing protein [Eubacteriales bacterium]